MTPTRRPGQGEIFYVSRPVRARECPSSYCDAALLLSAGQRIVAEEIVPGQSSSDASSWIAFAQDGDEHYVRGSALADEPPTATPTATPTSTPTAKPTATPTATDTASPVPSSTFTPTPTPARVLVIYTRDNTPARIRSCPGTSCDLLGRMSPGDRLDLVGRVEGQVVFGSAIWIEFVFEGQPAFVHSSLVRPTS